MSPLTALNVGGLMGCWFLNGHHHLQSCCWGHQMWFSWICVMNVESFPPPHLHLAIIWHQQGFIFPLLLVVNKTLKIFSTHVAQHGWYMAALRQAKEPQAGRNQWLLKRHGQKGPEATAPEEIRDWSCFVISISPTSISGINNLYQEFTVVHII